MDRIRQFSKSFSYAFRGLSYAIKNEKNFQNELAIGILVVLAMAYFQVTRAEMVVLFMVVMAVLIMELLNTIMERVVDILKPRVHPYARLIKDLMAASVLLTSILAVIIGILIFTPYVLKVIN
jgi:diacylglycerol kinase